MPRSNARPVNRWQWLLQFFHCDSSYNGIPHHCDLPLLVVRKLLLELLDCEFFGFNLTPENNDLWIPRRFWIFPELLLASLKNSADILVARQSLPRPSASDLTLSDDLDQSVPRQRRRWP